MLRGSFASFHSCSWVKSTPAAPLRAEMMGSFGALPHTTLMKMESMASVLMSVSNFFAEFYSTVEFETVPIQSDAKFRQLLFRCNLWKKWHVCHNHWLIVFLPVLQSCSHWVEMQMERLVSSPSLSREINMIAAPPQEGMMGTVGVPPLKIMTVTRAMDSVLRQVSL